MRQPCPIAHTLLRIELGTSKRFRPDAGIRPADLNRTLGYWRKPELSAATLSPDPAGGPARVYRTGHLGHMLPDGCLKYRGREDFQVKVRGHRIQVVEVEMV